MGVQRCRITSFPDGPFIRPPSDRPGAPGLQAIHRGIQQTVLFAEAEADEIPHRILGKEDANRDRGDARSFGQVHAEGRIVALEPHPRDIGDQEIGAR